MLRPLDSFRFLLSILLVTAALVPTHARAGADPCLEALQDAHWQPPANAHILASPDGGYEVLLPEADETFRVARVDTLSQARQLARSIDDPIDFGAFIEKRRAHLDELLSILREFKGADESIEISARTKQVESLRKKIFEKARTKGRHFHLGDIDDVLGARVAVSDPARMESVATRLKELPGLDVVKFDRIAYDRGYRAVHLTVRTESGTVFEIQVMTRRMLAWVLWNAKRIYKPRVSPHSPYFKRLKAYDREIINYLNALDAKPAELPTFPDASRHGILPADEFPAEELK